MVFSGKEALTSKGNHLLGIANGIGHISNKTTSYLATFDFLIDRRYSIVDHELGHLCGGIHSDCQYDGNSSLASAMCQGLVKDPSYFSTASEARIGKHIYSNNYLQKATISISGNDFVNNGANVTFTASPFPANMFNWSAYPMELLNTSGSSATFKTGRDGTSYATITTASGASMSGSVYVGKPVISIDGPNRTPNTGYATYRAIYDYRCSPTTFEWILNPKGNNSVYGANTNLLDIAFYQTGSYQIVVRAANKFGMGEYTVSGVNVYNSNRSLYTIIAYPNPATQTLHVDFSSINSQQTQAFKTTTQQKYDIRLFNLQGVLVRNTQSTSERISFDVSGLPNGNYFLQIYDGKTENPIVQQIVVSH